jgi:membrane-associated phospholipid phosphatase
LTPARLAAVTLAVVATLAVVPSIGSAQQRRHGRTPVSDAAPVAVGGAVATLAAGVALYIGTPAERPQGVSVWRGGMLADDGFRSSMHATGLNGQDAAMNVSDLLLVGTIANAGLIDALVIPMVQGDSDLAWQASAAHALAFGISLSIGGVVKQVANRARPYEAQCVPGEGGACEDGDIYQSFYSLHSGLAFTSAGFSCAMHMERDLYDDPLADGASCIGSVALASATGLLRVVADRHYLSDVLIGGALGFAVGYIVPLIFVPSRRGETDHAHPREDDFFTWNVMPQIAPETNGGLQIGAAISGTF